MTESVRVHVHVQGDPTKSHSKRSETITRYSERNPGISSWTVILLQRNWKKKTGGVTIDRSFSIDPLHGTRPIARIAGASFAEQRKKGGSERRAGGRWNMGATGSRKSQATVWKMIRGRGGGRISAITRQQCNWELATLKRGARPTSRDFPKWIMENEESGRACSGRAVLRFGN